MKIKLLGYTPNAEELLIFAKSTRRDDFDAESMQDFYGMDAEKKAEEVDYILSTIKGPWEFVDYTIMIEGVSRAFTHQLVRTRVGVSFAQQSLRIADPTKQFKYHTPESISVFEDVEYEDDEDPDAAVLYHDYMLSSAQVYRKLTGMHGIPKQDARGVLPIHTKTNILMKINLAALNHMMNSRLCFRTAGEYQEVARTIRGIILGVHPWAAPAMLPFCLEWGVCRYKKFDDCPLKQKYPILHGPKRTLLDRIQDDWSKTGAYSNQPE